WLSFLTVLLLIPPAFAATRPRYGGTLRVEMRAAAPSLDPAVAATGNDSGVAQISPLVYDTLVRLDAGGRPAASSLGVCQQESERHWRCTLRGGVHFSDGTLLTPMLVAQSLHQ